ncbi:MAG: GNAT family protein [Ginsengibacter sp.]
MIEIFNPSENYILEDERVLLRPLQPEDKKYLLPFSLNEQDLWKYSLVSAAGEKELQNYMSLAFEAKASGKEYPFIVFDKKTNEYAGTTRFYDINIPYKTLQLGYTWYGKSFQGTGLNKHCKYLLLSFTFEKLGMERVEFRADNNNARSIAAMKSLGCKVEGILRDHQPTIEDGVRRDSIVLSVLKEKWFDEVKENLAKKLH